MTIKQILITIFTSISIMALWFLGEYLKSNNICFPKFSISAHKRGKILQKKLINADYLCKSKLERYKYDKS